MSADDKAPVVLPLTPLQGGILAASTGGRAQELYVTQAAFTLSQPVNADQWAHVWQRLVDRHEALRCVFVVSQPGEPVQLVLPEVRLDVPVRHVTEHAPAEQHLAEERACEFALDRAPLLRTTLLIDASGNCTHVMTFHHALLDGWSVELLINEALALYGGQSLEDPVPLKRYLGWYHKQRDTAAQWWHSALAGWPGPLTIPGDSGDNGDGMQDSVQTLIIDGPGLEALRACAARTGLTLNAMLGGIWTALLARVSGERDVMIGVVASGRDAPVVGIGRIVGLVMNAMAVRVAVDPTDSLVATARGFSDVLAQSTKASHVPLGQLLRSAGRAGTGLPYDTMLVFEQVPEAVTVDGAPGITAREYYDRTSVPLSLLVFPSDNRLECRFQFNSRRFSAEIVNALADALAHAIGGFQATPDPRLRFTAPTRAPDASEPGVPRVADQIATHLEQRGDAIAVTQGDRQTSWSQLHQRVGAVCGWLAGAVDSVASPVVVRMTPGADAVAVLLAAVLSGRPYVYLDPAYPDVHHDRVIAVLEDEFGDRLIKVSDHPDSDFESAHGILARETRMALPRPSTADLAYIVFTSGSTGSPKGVRVSHANLDYSNAARGDMYPDSPERFLLLSSLSFDSSVAGLFWTLAAGAELVLTPDPLALSLDQLAPLVRRHRVTHTLCLPSVYRTMLEGASDTDLDSLRCAIVAGEAATGDVVEIHQKRCVSARLHNEYGPSEATVWCAMARIDGVRRGDEIPVGNAPPGTSLVVMNQLREALPDGISGELVVSGPGVSQGYIGASSAGVFFETVHGRSYATGDLAVVRDGVVYVRGRLDDQVKINGVRVELGEIDAGLLLLPGVVAAAAVDVPGTGGRTQLIGHVEMDSDGDGFDATALRAELAGRFPAAMVPVRLQVHDVLPVLGNGKIDRASLRKIPDDGSPDFRVGDVNAPASIRALMQEVTGVAPESDSVSFFDAGGDSLAAVNLVDRINRFLNVRINIADVYEFPTPAGLGSLVNARTGRDDWAAVTPVNSGGDLAPVYMAYGNAAILSHHLGPDVPLYWVVHGRHGIVYPTEALTDLARRHYDQIKLRQSDGPYCLAGFSLGALVIVEVARLMRESGDAVPVLFLLDPTSPSTYVAKGRARRLFRILGSDLGLLARLRYAAGRLRELVRGMRDPSDRDGGDVAALTLHDNEKISRAELIREVSDRLEAHAFAPCPGDAVVVMTRTDGPAKAHQMNERMIWDSLFEGSVEHVTVSTSGAHTEIFADADAMAVVARLLRDRLERGL